MNRRDETPARRSEDRDKMAAFNAWWDRWGRTIIWPLLLAGGVYVREHYLKPIEAIPVLQAQQAVARQIDSVSLAQRADIMERLDGHDVMFQILVKMQCEQIQGTVSRELARLCAELPDLPTDRIRRILKAQPKGAF